jgi:hypothetical protein
MSRGLRSSRQTFALAACPVKLTFGVIERKPARETGGNVRRLSGEGSSRSVLPRSRSNVASVSSTELMTGVTSMRLQPLATCSLD